MSKLVKYALGLQQLLVLLVCSSFLVYGATTNAIKNYIVYMGDVAHPTQESTISCNHHLLAKAITRRFGVKHAVIHHYTKSFRGFSAMLTPEEASFLSEMDEVVSVFESKTWSLQTTHSWEFLGTDKINPGSNSGFTDDYMKAQSDVIIGVIDTGVWPESLSFDDAGLPPVPSRFKGMCESGDKFNASNCNRKIIGARYYSKGFEASNGPLESSRRIFYRSPRDADGHGTHTASTAAGAVVNNASVLGILAGTAKGGAPGARLAIYKACWFGACNDADLLAAFDDATEEGVDIISLSVGFKPKLFVDGVSIGSFHAFSKGILVSASAGNSGLPGNVANVAPWILTVAASSIDRSYSSNVLLGNNMTLKGEAVNPVAQNGIAGLVAGSTSAALGVSQTNASFCLNNTLDPTKIKGKVVVCTMSASDDNKVLKSVVVKEGGGAGIIVVDPIRLDIAIQFAIPGTVIGQKQEADLMAYLASDINPTAYIGTTVTVLNVQKRPQMAMFSALGPNVITPDIIKPDVTAPGVSILAAWSPVALEAGGRSVNFNIKSGTSMSCPHVSGVAALIKAQHPTWSPAAIKSALMTTAFVVDNTNQSILRSPGEKPTGPFDYGSGHIDPVAALNPGLVYDHDVNDVINFLCSNGATPSQLKNLTGSNNNSIITCMANPTPSYNLNYPSIGVANLNGSVTVSRTLTSFASGGSLYQAIVQAPPGVAVDVIPQQLSFEKEGEKKSFTVKFTVTQTASDFVFGSLTWSDGKHEVYSPIAVNPIFV